MPNFQVRRKDMPITEIKEDPIVEEKKEETSGCDVTLDVKQEFTPSDNTLERVQTNAITTSMNEAMSPKKMTMWSTDKIVAVGLVIMGILSISGYIGYALYTGNSNGTEIPMAIVSGLTGFLGRGAVDGKSHIIVSSDPKEGGFKDNGQYGTR